MRVFVSGTGTDVGKTWVGRGIARALARRGTTLAIKPYETGVVETPVDASALASAAGREYTSDILFRHEMPLSPLSIHEEGHVLPAPAADFAQELERAAQGVDHVLAEGAGGILVPTRPGETIADLAVALGWPVILVAPNRLGVQSDVFCAHEASVRRGLDVRAVVLSAVSEPDVSQRTNQAVIESFNIPVFVLPRGRPNASDDEIADLVEASGLLNALESR